MNRFSFDFIFAKSRKLFNPRIIICIFGLLCMSCQNLDDIYTRLDNLETSVNTLQSAVNSLQDAYGQGKIITSVTPIPDGWRIFFSDNSNIDILNGINGADGIDGQDGQDGQDGIDGIDGMDGVTPFLKIDSNGYWTVSYDNGKTFVALLDDEGDKISASGRDGVDGINGSEGLSIRLSVNSDGYYVIQTYRESEPEIVIKEIVTPYSADPSCIISSIQQDDKTHIITMILSDGTEFSFNMYYATPTGIAVLSVNPIYLSSGTQASIEFRVNPSNASLSLDLDDNQIVLDLVGQVQTRSSYVTDPDNYKMIRVEQVYDGETEEMKVGQYRAIIEDTEKSFEYDEMVALVINTEDANGNPIQLSSSAIRIIGNNDESFVINGLPAIVINTPNSTPIDSKDTYVTGSTFSLINTDNIIDFQGEMKIKGRGNTTWGQPKKPYKMKFDEKISFFGGTNNKEWVLLANYLDCSMIRTALTFYMAEMFGSFEYVPKYNYADVFLNGNYEGTYQFGDQVEIAKGRVLNGEDGYLLEVDHRAKAEAEAGEAVIFYAPHINNPFNIKDLKIGKTDEVVEGDDNYNYIKNFVTGAADALYGDSWLDETNGYKKYIDMESFVEWFLINEISKNNDACFFSSCFMSLKKQDDAKLTMGPVWDFDLAYGVPEYNDMKNPENFWIKNSGWYPRLFQDPKFVASVKTKFAQYYNSLDQIISYIDILAISIEKSAIANNRVWKQLGNDDNSAKVEFYYHVGEVKEYLSHRMNWLKTQFDEM